MNHLSEERLNEYLDQALVPDVLVEVQAHLVVCHSCSARLAELVQLFAEIGSLSDQILEVDLSPSILLKLEQPGPLPRTVWGLVILQGVFVFLGGIFAWPLAQAALPLAFFAQIPSFTELLTRFTGAFRAWFALSGNLRLPDFSLWMPGLDLPSTSLMLTALGLLLLWLAGNGLFFFPHSWRRS